MRATKFRAWAMGVMLYPGYEGDSFASIPMCGQPLDLTNGGMATNFILMQFTGLQDSEGVDIYEGDVVESHTHPKIAALRHAVKWRDEITGWWMHNLNGKDDKDGSTQLWVGMKYGPFKVIGNIYEHPELVEGE